MIRRANRNSRMFEYDSQRLHESDRDLDANLALWDALEDGDTDAVKEALEKGANPNSKSKYGETALVNAIESYDTDSANLLLKAGADPNVKNMHGETILSWAATSGGRDLLEVLLNAGANPNVKDDDGETVLIYMVRDGDEYSVKLLLDAGANPNIKNNDGKTALDIAEKEDYPEIVELLLDAGSESKKTNKTKSSEYIAEIDRIKGVVHDKNHKSIEGTAFEEKIGVEKTFNSLQELTDGVLDYLGKELDVSIEENLDYVDTDDGVFIYGFFEPHDNGDVLNYKVRVKVYDDKHHPVSIDDLLDAIGEEEPLGNGIW